MEWKTVKLGEVLTIKYGKDHKALGAGTIPVYGSGGIMRYADKAIYDKPSILIPRKGSLNNIFYVDKPFWTVDTMFWSIIDTEKADPHFLFYAICKLDFAGLNVGSAVPSLTVPIIEAVELPLPPLETQRRIAAILSSLDDKIENNNRINRNLEAQAQALFKSWFVDFEPWGGTMPGDWREGTLGDIIEEQPKSKIQVNAAKDVKGKYPFFTSGSSIYEYNEALISGRNLYLNTGGAAGIEFYVGEAAYSTDTWCIKGIDDFTDFLYLYITSIINIIDTEYFEGSALKHLKKKPFKERKIIIPANKIKDDFNKKVVPIFDIIMNNYSENKRLAALRDTLLPKIMKGEIAL